MKGIFKNNQHLSDVVKGGGINLIFYGLNIVIVYVIAIVISKFYGAEAYGRFSIIKSLILVLIIFGTLGLNTLAIRLSSDKNHYNKNIYSSDFLKKSYIIVSFSSFMIAAIFFFFKTEIATYIFNDAKLEDYLAVFPALLFFATLLNYNSNLFKGQGKVLLFSIVSSFLGNFILLLLILTIYYFFSNNEVYLMVAFLAGIVIAFSISIYHLLPVQYASKYDSISIKKLLSIGLPMMMSASMIYLIFSVDVLMLGIFETSESVGIYRIITQLASLNTIFVIVLGTVIGPKVSFLYSQNKLGELKKIIRNVSKLIFYVTLPILIAILIFSKEILLFFGNNHLVGLNALIILSLCQFFFAMTGFVDLILNMTGHQKVYGTITLIMALINVLLNLILIPHFGILGAAIATGFSIVVTNAITAIYIKKKLKVLPVFLPIIKV